MAAPLPPSPSFEEGHPPPPRRKRERGRE